MTIKGRQVKVVLWDTAGQERFVAVVLFYLYFFFKI